MAFPTDQSSDLIDGLHFFQEKELFQSKVLQRCSQCSIYLLLGYTENKTQYVKVKPGKEIKTEIYNSNESINLKATILWHKRNQK
jgi:hypothetical protein